MPQKGNRTIVAWKDSACKSGTERQTNRGTVGHGNEVCPSFFEVKQNCGMPRQTIVVRFELIGPFTIWGIPQTLLWYA